ncbi:alpha/beta fold hydrolase [Streptosporangium soli]|nr:alpha/beta hydrolase [Streptosporangium sp. KLBMP 9127]
MLKEIVLALALAGSAVAATQPDQAGALDWSACADDQIGMECAELKVPVDWQKPAGRTITLALGRLPATGDPEGSVLVAYGGPGGPGIALTKQIAPQWAALRKRMDIVTWDTRGYGAQFGGKSTGLPCAWTRTPLAEFPADEPDFGRLSDTNRGYAEACRLQDPEFFANMSSADNARDMEAIRKALGESKLNFYGASYAGLYAQAYARLFPGQVRTMVLDGTVSHSLTDWNRELDDAARRNEASFGRFLTWCGKDDSCEVTSRSWRKLVADADRSPIPAKRAGVHYDGRDLQSFALGLARRGEPGWPALARTIQEAGRGDASGFAPERGLRYPDQSTGVTECLDWPRAKDRAELTAAVSRLRRLAPNTGTAGTLVAATLTCVGWPVPVTNPPSSLPDDLPPLLGAGAWNESDSVQQVLDQVPGSGSVRHEGPGHTLYLGNACAREHIDRYFTEQVIPPNGTTC